MIRLQSKLIGVLLVMVAAIVISAGKALAADVLEFIDIPDTGEHQATVEPILACKNGFAFGFHALRALALQETGPRPWDISFATDDGSLLIKEYPLWLGEDSAPLVRNGETFSYVGYYTLLWTGSVPAAPLDVCYSGAGTGFCNTRLDIDDCEINPRLMADIARIGVQNTTRVVTDTLVFEVRAYDPEVGTNNGDGIAQVGMEIIHTATGAEIFSLNQVSMLSSTAELTSGVVYCAFSQECAPWVFSDHDYTWPNGEPVENGSYLLRAVVSTPGNARKVVQTQIEINVPPYIQTDYVPGGDFPMGSDSGIGTESPVHTVGVNDFWIMETEVTNKLYAQCVKAEVCTAPSSGARWRDPAYADHPVTGITWQQANTFAAWVGGRLPTEAEWEKACRSTDGRTYPWGNAAATQEAANYDNVVGDTTPVGSYPMGAGPYGTLDMGGNVWEWTSSLEAEYPYHADDGREDQSAVGRRIVRGGSYYYTHYQLACSTRLPVAAEESNPQIGLRVVFDKPLNAEGVHFVTPQDGDTVPPTFDVEMSAEGILIEPAGEIHAGAGHFHILVDTDFLAPGELIPFDEQHLHFGQGQFTTTLELEPGVHVLRLQVANGAHQALDSSQYQDEITITVAAGY